MKVTVRNKAGLFNADNSILAEYSPEEFDITLELTAQDRLDIFSMLPTATSISWFPDALNQVRVYRQGDR